MFEFPGMIQPRALAFTGHRPDKLGGYGATAAASVTALAHCFLSAYKPAVAHVGMALGWDVAVVKAAVGLGIPFVAWIPFKGQELGWSEADQQNYHYWLGYSRTTHYLASAPVGDKWAISQMYHNRNSQMIKAADGVVALWDGSKGGTGWTVNHAKAQGKPVINLWSEWEKF